MRRTSPLAGGRSWPFSVALAAALSAASPWLLHLFDGKRPIDGFAGRAIGRVVLEGFDVSGYAKNYVLLWALTLAVFLAASALLVRLRDAMLRSAGEEALAAGFRGLARFSELSVVFLLFRLWSRDPRALAMKGLADRALVLLLLFVVARVLLERWAVGSPAFDRVLRRLAGDSDFLLALLFAPAPLLFAAHLAAGRPLHAGDKLLAAWLLLYAAIAAGFVLVMARRTRQLDDGAAAARLASAEWTVALAALPLAAFPLAFPVGNEIQALARGLSAETAVWGCGALLVAAGAAAVAYWRRRGRERTPPVVRRLLVYGYYPLLVVTAAVFVSHFQALDLGALDYFHQGEKVLPVQQLFDFGTLPQVELRLSHSFSDAAYGFLYALVSGDHGLGVLLWDRWLPHVVGLLVLYLFLARTVGATFSALVCCLMPVVTIAPVYYAPALVPALCLVHAVERPGARRWLLVWIAAAAVLLWRIDFGLAGAVALALSVAVFLLRAPRGRWRTVGLSLAAFAGGALVLLAALSLATGTSLFDTLGRLFGSYTSRLVTRTRSYVIHRFDLAAVLQYYLLPAVAALHLGVLALRRWLGRRLAPQHYLLLYAAAFSLVISLRSLERHSLSEFFNPYLFGLLLALTPVLWVSAAPRERSAVRLGFLATLAAAVLFVLPPAGYERTPNHPLRLADHRPLFELRTWRPGEARVRWEEARHRPLVELLDDALADGQTFYDFTNSPLLYPLAGREYPIWVIPNLIQTGERMQAEVIAELDRWRAADRLPLVVFKQGHPFWDTADGVPNEIRSYRVAEWIYRHYAPWVRAGGYQVWRAREAGPPPAAAAATGPSWRLGAAPGPPEVHDLRVLPRVEGDGDGAGAGWRVETWGHDPRISRFADLSPLPDLDGRDELRLCWLRIEYRTTRGGFVEVRFAADGHPFDGRHMVQLPVDETAGGETGQLLVPLTFAERARRWTGLRLDPPRDVTFEVVRLDVVRRPLVPLTSPAAIEQDFDLVRLPRVWAEHDPYQASTRTAVLATLEAEPVALAAGEQIAWPLDPGVDRSRGSYLHLRLRPQPGGEAKGPVRLVVRDGPEQAGGFRFEVETESRHQVPPSGTARLDGAELLGFNARRVYEAAGGGRVAGLFPLAGLPPIAPGAVASLRFHYRARGGRPVAVAVGFDGDAARVAGVLAGGGPADSDAGAVGSIELPAADAARRLTALAFELPPGTFFEPLSATLAIAAPSDHLVRLSTRWSWWAAPPEMIVLSADAPVVVEAAWLRAGD